MSPCISTMTDDPLSCLKSLYSGVNNARTANKKKDSPIIYYCFINLEKWILAMVYFQTKTSMAGKL